MRAVHTPKHLKAYINLTYEWAHLTLDKSHSAKFYVLCFIKGMPMKYYLDECVYTVTIKIHSIIILQQVILTRNNL